MAAGIARCPNARMAYVTPSYQYPLGTTMYRFHGRPLASLQGLDRNGRVIHLGSFSRVLFPALRLSYLVVPPYLVDPCIAARAAIEGPQRCFEQSVAADFMEQGHFVRHLRRMRTLYSERQRTLLKAVDRDLAGLLEVQPADGGMFLVGWLRRGMNDRLASRIALEHGIVADPISPLYMQSPQRGALLLGYTCITPAQIREGVRKLASALRSAPL